MEGGYDDVDAMVARVPEDMRPQVAGLARDVLFMRDALASARADLRGQPLMIEYDNGGGQEGVRRNPGYDAYEALVRSYQSALTCLRDILGSGNAGSGQPRPRSGLNEMRGRFRMGG